MQRMTCMAQRARRSLIRPASSTSAAVVVFSGRTFTGTITDAALWNYALSAQQVATIYAAR